MHVSHSVCPVRAAYLPAAHDPQLDDPGATLNVPVAHGAHDELVAYVPAVHMLHSVEPVSAVNLPAAHTSQAEADGITVNVPGGHCVHVVA